MERWQAIQQKSGGKSGLAERLMEIGRHCASLPSLDDRTDDEILGYDEYGLPR